MKRIIKSLLLLPLLLSLSGCTAYENSNRIKFVNDHFQVTLPDNLPILYFIEDFGFNDMVCYYVFDLKDQDISSFGFSFLAENDSHAEADAKSLYDITISHDKDKGYENYPFSLDTPHRMAAIGYDQGKELKVTDLDTINKDPYLDILYFFQMDGQDYLHCIFGT